MEGHSGGLHGMGNTWKGTAWYGSTLVVYHGMKGACEGECYVGDAYEHMVCDDYIWDKKRLKECLQGSMIEMLG